MPPNALVTAEELLQIDAPGKRTELVRGRLRVSEPPGSRHGAVSLELAVLLANHVKAQGLGRVFAAETGFQLARDPDTVRAADVAFVSTDRLPSPLPAGYASLAPDLAVEVLSPGERPAAVLSKVADWLDAGSRLVWVIDPARAHARIYRADGSESYVDHSGALDGEDVLPGFACELADLFI